MSEFLTNSHDKPKNKTKGGGGGGGMDTNMLEGHQIKYNNNGSKIIYNILTENQPTEYQITAFKLIK